MCPVLVAGTEPSDPDRTSSYARAYRLLRTSLTYVRHTWSFSFFFCVPRSSPELPLPAPTRPPDCFMIFRFFGLK